jgi:gas vesicle protein
MNGDTFKYTLIGDDRLTRPLKDAENQTRRLGNQVARTNKQMGAFSSNLANAGRGSRAFAMGGLQQAGYQIGDFAVQVANGTSKMQAFGQQAPQFLQIFGPVGSIIGAAVAVAAAFGVVAEKMGKQAKNAGEAIDLLRQSVDQFKQAAADASMPLEEMEKKFGTLAQTIKNDLLFLQELKFDEALGSIAEVGRTTEDAFKKLLGPLNAVFDRMKEGETEGLENLIRHVMNIGKEAGVTFQQIEDLRNSLSTMQEASSVDEVLSSTDDFLASITSLRDSMKEPPAQFDELVKKIREARIEAARLAAIRENSNKAEVNAEAEIAAFTHRTRMENIRLKDVYNDMVEAQKERKKFLDDELIVMQQVVKQSGILLTNMQKFRPDKVYGGRGGDPRKQTADYMNQLGYTSVEDLIEQLSDKGPKTIKRIRDEVVKLSPEAQRMADLGEAIGNSFENAMLSAVDGTMKAKDAFRVMAADIIKELYRVFIVKKITGFITDAITFSAGPKTGNTGSFGLPDFSYNGGGYTGNGARAGGMDGKGGFMAMLHPRETVVDHTRGQGGGVTVVQNINVSTGVQQTVRTEIKSLMPQIAESAKAAVADAKRRGGSYGRAFA